MCLCVFSLSLWRHSNPIFSNALAVLSTIRRQLYLITLHRGGSAYTVWFYVCVRCRNICACTYCICTHTHIHTALHGFQRTDCWSLYKQAKRLTSFCYTGLEAHSNTIMLTNKVLLKEEGGAAASSGCLMLSKITSVGSCREKKKHMSWNRPLLQKTRFRTEM